MPLVLPQSYSAARVVLIPVQPQTVGDHIRRRRQLLQRDVAERIGITQSCVWNWEANGSQPDFRYKPALIAFLGYNPAAGGQDARGEVGAPQDGARHVSEGGGTEDRCRSGNFGAVGAR